MKTVEEIKKILVDQKEVLRNRYGVKEIEMVSGSNL